MISTDKWETQSIRNSNVTILTVEFLKQWTSQLLKVNTGKASITINGNVFPIDFKIDFTNRHSTGLADSIETAGIVGVAPEHN